MVCSSEERKIASMMPDMIVSGPAWPTTFDGLTLRLRCWIGGSNRYGQSLTGTSLGRIAGIELVSRLTRWLRIWPSYRRRDGT